MENNPKEIDTKYEAAVAIVKTVFKKRNFKRFLIMLLVVAVPITVFFMNGGVQLLMAVFGLSKGVVK